MSWFCKYIVKNEPTLTQSLQDPFFFWYFQLFLLFFTSYAKNPTSGHKRKLSGSKSLFCKCTIKNEPTLTQSLQDPFFSDIFSCFCYFLPVTPKIQRPDINGNCQARKVGFVNARSKMSQRWRSPCKIRFSDIFSSFCYFLPFRANIQGPDINGKYQAQKVGEVNDRSKMI